LFLRTSLGLDRYVLNSAGVIVDSGTTLMITPLKVTNALKQRFSSMCAQTNLVGICNATAGKSLWEGYCFPMTDAQIAQFPNVSVTLKGTSALVIPPQAYIFEGAGVPGMSSFSCSFPLSSPSLFLLFFFAFSHHRHHHRHCHRHSHHPPTHTRPCSGKRFQQNNPFLGSL